MAIFGVLCCAGVASPAVADDTQAWFAVFANGPVSADSKLLVWFDGHARYRNDAEELDTTILRPGVGWRVGKGLDLWVGYARIETQRTGRDLIEDRAWQQASYPVAEWLGGRLTGRTRLEQRFRETGSDTGWRLRQMFRYARPFAADKRFGLLVSTEIFANFDSTDWGQRSGFDQNRALFGGYFQPSKHLRVEAGYMHQHIRVAGPAPDRRNDNLSLTVVVPL